MNPVITPTDATLGAVVSNVRLAALDDEAFATIEEAWHAHAVLIFPDQHLSEQEQVDFSRRFGPLERSPHQDPHARRSGDHPPLQRQEGRDALGADSDTGRLRKGNNYWHTDSSYKRIPAKASLLTAKIVPKTGGETAFADMRAAYGRPRCRHAGLAHGQDRDAQLRLQPGQGRRHGRITQDEWDDLPPVEQPVIRTHPATGRRNLYIGRHASHIVGEDHDESRKLLEELCVEAAGRPVSTSTSGRWAIWSYGTTAACCTGAWAIPPTSRAAWSAPPSPATATRPTSGWLERGRT